MTARRVLMIDNEDSFTFILADYFERLGANVRVVRSKTFSVAEALDPGNDAIVISPGPGTPEDAGISVPLAAACVTHRRPMLGVCLGHQAIALACGSQLRRVEPVHGKAGPVSHDGSGLFDGLPSPMTMTRYHSLAVPEPIVPLIANAWSHDGLVMGFRHRDAPVHGVQFHPESIASEHGLGLLKRFLRSASACTA